jgi:hypothetical protein
MPLAPEEAQMMTNLQRRILQNVAAGKPSADGITKEELTASLNLLRGDRAKSLAAGAEKAAKAKKGAKAATPSGPSKLDELLKARGISLD